MKTVQTMICYYIMYSKNMKNLNICKKCSKYPKIWTKWFYHLLFEPWHDKTNKVTVRPAKTQISLGICPVWSESSLCTQWVAKDPSFLQADSKDWSDWADAQADLSLRWAHTHFVGFVVSRLISSVYRW